MKKYSNFVIALAFFTSQHVPAFDGGLSELGQQKSHLASEYVFKTDQNQKMMPVKLEEH